MPTYDYICTDCEHRFEVFQSMSEDPVKTCPKCSKKNVRRLIGWGTGLIFKGSGFYLTDYVKNKNDKNKKPKTLKDKKNNSKNKDSKKTKSKTKSKDGKKWIK